MINNQNRYTRAYAISVPVGGLPPHAHMLVCLRLTGPVTRAVARHATGTFRRGLSKGVKVTCVREGTVGEHMRRPVLRAIV